MENEKLLIIAMVEQCRQQIQKEINSVSDLPPTLHPRHLLWMCDRIENRAKEWPATKLHRWIGFVQCGMLANNILDFEAAKAMFDKAKSDFGGRGDDDDLIDHLNPDDSFKLDIGGQG